MATLNSLSSLLCLLGAQVTNVCYMYVAFILLTLITMSLCFCYVLCLILFIHQPERKQEAEVGMDKILHFCNIRDWNTGLQVLFVVVFVSLCYWN